MIKTIAFDLDDTLWDVKPVLINAEKQLDLFLSREFPSLIYDVTAMRVLREEVMEQDAQIVNRITEFRRRIIALAMIKSGITSDEAESGATKAMGVFLHARNQIEFFADVIPTLQDLSSRFILGVLTNGNADIHRLGLSEYFSFSFSAEEVSAPKPATDLFEIALNHTSSSPPEMIYVGDDLKLDVETAQKVGLHTVWVNRKKHREQETHPSETIFNIGELPAAVDRINQRFL